MGRHASGWKLKGDPRRPGTPFAVRFTHEGKQYTLSTGESDAGKAGAEAARIYARFVGGVAPRPESRRVLISEPLKVTFARWLVSLAGTLDPATIKTYGDMYARKHWLGFYANLEGMCSEHEREAYRTFRLQRALTVTVKKEVWAQEKFLRWCKKPMGLIGLVPPPLEWDEKTRGKRTGPQRAKPVELDTDQVEAFLSALPEWREVGSRAEVKKPYPIRDRFVV